MSTQGRVRIGISGWRYAPWRGVFYPEGLKQDDELAFASRRLASIEINGSFYSLQSPVNWQRWYDATPARFVFSVKAPRFITHIKRLRDVRAPLANFFASGLLQLRDKLGPFLWQLPPSFKFDAEVIDAFLALLPRTTEAARALAHHREARMRGRSAMPTDRDRRLRHALEVRHESFRDPAFIALLRKHRVAIVVADTAGTWPRIEDLTSDFVYMRLHGAEELYASGYTPQALDDWAARIDAWRRGTEPDDETFRLAARSTKRARRDVYCYFDNDIKVCAPRDARALATRLGVVVPESAAAEFLETRSAAKRRTKTVP